MLLGRDSPEARSWRARSLGVDASDATAVHPLVLVTRNKRTSRVVYGVYVVVVAAFVVSNIVQVARAVFGSPENEAVAAEASRFPKVGPACGALLEAQLQAIEKARAAAATEPNGDAAKARYANERSAARSPELEPTCSADPSGTDALAALARFDRAAESHSVRQASELTPVRLAAQSFISGHPR